MLKINNVPPPLQKKGLEEKLLKVCKENDVTFLALFGSFARGEQRKRSDIDIAINYQPGKAKTLFDLIETEEQLRRIFKRKVDLGIFDAINPRVMKYIKKEMRIIYETSQPD